MVKRVFFRAAVCLSLAFVCSFARAELRRTLYKPFDFAAYQSSGAKIPVAFFDADSTLRVTRSGEVAPNTAEDVELLPFVGTKTALAARQGFFVAIVSNQGGIGRFLTLEQADQAIARTAELTLAAGGMIHYFDYAESNNEDRKPGIGMARRLEAKLREWSGNPNLQIDLQRSYMVGDSAWARGRNGNPGDTRPDGQPGTNFSNSDRLFAENLGIPFRYVREYFDLQRLNVDYFENFQQLSQARALCRARRMNCR